MPRLPADRLPKFLFHEGSNQARTYVDGHEIWLGRHDYDAVGRLNNLAGPGLPTGGVTYERYTNSGLLWKTTFGTGSPLPAQIVRTYETSRAPLDQVDTAPARTSNRSSPWRAVVGS